AGVATAAIIAVDHRRAMIAVAAAPAAAGMIAIGVPGAAVTADAAGVPAAGRAVIDARGAALRAMDHGAFAARRAVECIGMEAAAAAAAPRVGRVDGESRSREDNSQKLTLDHGLFP